MRSLAIVVLLATAGCAVEPPQPAASREPALTVLHGLYGFDAVEVARLLVEEVYGVEHFPGTDQVFVCLGGDPIDQGVYLRVPIPKRGEPPTLANNRFVMLVDELDESTLRLHTYPLSVFEGEYCYDVLLSSSDGWRVESARRSGSGGL